MCIRDREASWDVLGVYWRSWGTLGRLGCLGRGRLGSSWRPPGGLLKASWGNIGASWAPLGAILEDIDQ
eukprot:3878319-Pyramimonas_sp.AAC.1